MPIPDLKMKSRLPTAITYVRAYIESALANIEIHFKSMNLDSPGYEASASQTQKRLEMFKDNVAIR